jgi:hypothetical protein
VDFGKVERKILRIGTAKAIYKVENSITCFKAKSNPR